MFTPVCFFKQKTAYEMRISYWSSDVCSSDLDLQLVGDVVGGDRRLALRVEHRKRAVEDALAGVAGHRGWAGQPASFFTRSTYFCFASSWPVPASLAQASYLAVATKSKKPGFGPLTSPSEPCLYRAYRRRRVSLSGRSDSPWTSCLACSKRACRSDIVAFPRIGARMTARGRRRVKRPAGHLRTEERSAGKESVSKCGYRWSQSHKKKKKKW